MLEIGQPRSGAAFQAADPLSSGSSRLKAGCGQDWSPHKLFRLLLMLITAGVLFAQPAPPPSDQKDAPHQYSLPPDKLQKAIEYSTARNWLHFISPLYGIAVLLATLTLGWSAKFRDWAEAASRRRSMQAVIFVPLLILTIDVLSLPLAIYGQHLELLFDQSIQSWRSWVWDWTKSELITLALATLLVFILFAVIRRSPRRWWFYFWLASLPIIFTIAFLEPFVIEPMFFKFKPLATKHPALVDELEKVVARGGLAIPPDRMFEMKASEKLKSLNAYVTGFGASKRVVVWDTMLEQATTPETLFVFGHEMGHYVLGHVRNSLIVSSVAALFLLLAGFHVLHWLLQRCGKRWAIRGVTDWAALPLMLLLASVTGFLGEPVINAYSRWQEHQADVYGLEVIHGLVPDSKAVAAHSFQLLGEVDLEEPNPNPLIKFWSYSHPSISERVAFAARYDPWSSGTPQYVK
jgi:STE24 endopeptidase